MADNSTARNWCFTIHSDNVDLDKDQVKYAVYQREVCPTTKKEHWQGFFVATAPIRFKKAKSILRDPTAHVEKCKGTAEQNIAYCTKEDSRKEGTDPVEIGSRASIGQGKRRVGGKGTMTGLPWNLPIW